MRNTLLALLAFVTILAVIQNGSWFARNNFLSKKVHNAEQIPATIASTPEPTPSPSPLTFAQMNALYGPCVYAPTLMYHHIENTDDPTIPGHGWLTVSTKVFREQLQYLRDRGYTVATMQEVINFFETGVPLSPKPILITFDDGYNDFADQAVPVLHEFGYPSTLFLPTGLTENPEYMTWNQVHDAAGNRVLIANHTWSHKNVASGDLATIEHEITLADSQLAANGMNNPKVFSYPYGPAGRSAIGVLERNNYKLAFTTEIGGTLCKGRRFELPRIRIANTSLSVYGL